MYISKIRIENYKSFYDSGDVKLESGFNIVVGANSVGKTAFLECLRGSVESKPHYSLVSVPDRVGTVSPNTNITVEITVTGKEIERRMPIPPHQIDVVYITPTIIGGVENTINAIKNFKEYEHLKYHFKNNQLLEMSQSWLDQGEKLRLGVASSLNWTNLSAPYTNQTHSGNILGLFTDGQIVLANSCASAYIFRAERLSVSQCKFGSSQELATDARNLPEVLFNFQANRRSRIDEYLKCVKEIFPHINHVSVRHAANQHELEIVIWNEDEKLDRPDFAVRLSECGTGIGQVLAILYVCMTSIESRIIVIDEPNSFLHPSASRKLIDILRRYSQHQYIIATHAPEIIWACQPKTITLLRLENAQTKVEQLNTNQLNDIKRCFQATGTKLSDVFGVDRILWVEGECEEQVFPLILEQITFKNHLSINVVRVRSTGDFFAKNKNKHLQLLLDIYRRVNTNAGNAVWPASCGYIFDSETLSPEQKQDLTRQGISFLPRRMLENYLLVPEAIAAVLNTTETFKDNNISEAEIMEWFDNKKININDSSIDAAKALKELFNDVSETKENFEKTTHTVALVEYLLNNKRESVQELMGFIQQVIEPIK